MQFLVLGPLEMRSGSGGLPVRRGRPRLLLHVLLLNRRVSIPVEVIADRLWGEEVPSDAANAVHQLVSYLRRCLGADGRDLLRTTATGYLLNAADDQVDAWRFEHLVQSAMREIASDSAQAAHAGLENLDKALQYWRGEPYAESATFDWAAGDRARLQDAYLQAQESRLDALLLLGRHKEVVLEAQSLTAAYPIREQFHALLSLALYRTGRQGEALEVHRALREMLADELGIDPSPELQRLEQAILRQDPELGWSPPPDLPERWSRSRAGSKDGSNAVDKAPAPEEEAQPPKELPLPSWPTRIIGRAADVDALRRLVSSHRVTTLTGPGGVGKSRLALEVAGGLDGARCWFVDLSDIEADDQVAAIVADRLGLEPRPDQDSTERIQRSFAATEGLLLLDSCEQIVTGVKELVDGFAATAPQLRVLATSRRPLGALGEVVHKVPPLPLPHAEGEGQSLDNPAVQLFADRAQLVQADFRISADNLSDIVEIVTTLDGLPIAIELAAAHADVLSPAHIRGRIEGRLDALVTENPAISPRQRSLRAAIDASIVKFTEPEREFFLSVSIFPGSFDLDGAAAVSDQSPETVYDLTASLVRQSMIATAGPEGYRLLRPIRAYAHEQLRAASIYSAARRRHVDWVTAFAEARSEVSPGAPRREELNLLRGLLPDARVALESAIADGYVAGAAKVAVDFSWVWTLHGMASEGIEWLESVRRLTDSLGELGTEERRLKASVLRSLGLLANPVGRLELAREVCAEAAELSAALGDDVAEAAALLTLGIAQWALGDLDQAAESHDRAARVMAPKPDSWHYLAALVLRARTAMDRREPGFEDLIVNAVEQLQPSNEQQMLGLAIAIQARHLLRSGDLAAAVVTAEEALRVWRSIDYTEGEMSALNLIARASSAGGEHALAETLCLEALGIARRAAHRGALVESVESLALIAAAQSRREHALLLMVVCGRERERRAIPLLGADLDHMEAVERELVTALAGAVPLVRARGRLVRFDDLVDQLLAEG